MAAQRSYQVDGLLVVHAPAQPGTVPAGSARPPLLLVHGAGHGAWCWELWQQWLPAHGWESYALSLRNHPGSYDVDEATFLRTLRVEDYAEDVATVARHIGRPCVVVGHSMGGIVVQSFAARYLAQGGALAGLVLLAALGPGRIAPGRDTPLPTDQPYTLSPQINRERYFHTATPDVLQRALDRISPESPAVLNQATTGAGVAIMREQINCPVLSVTAEYDRTVVPRDGRIAEYYGGEWMHDAENGHDLMLEAGWEALLERILDWVNRVVPGAGARA